ncbi:GNAT family N-acetyltransferase [Methylobacterium sp. E-065]|uniref:GNAT family N-acetyltransferase n=1 Tax=Methylobacterium sp. E-065 TaxID=2836583 RepID=UPI001FBBFF00|nr:GNAT family N-acetyltransferase [Methylobacterium sp. E-065]MCJ2015888.1 GNAT family N-acetyltransferase [Methylobacterium sp. E-065]
MSVDRMPVLQARTHVVYPDRSDKTQFYQDRAKFIFINISEAKDTAKAYLDLKDRVMPRDGWALLNFTKADLLASQAWIGLLMVEDGLGAATAAAGMHIVRQGDGTARLQGVVTDPAFRQRGFCSTLLNAVLDRLHKGLRIETVDLVVRIMADGSINERAFNVFYEAGFRPVEDMRIAWSGMACDQHLQASLDARGTHYRARKMTLRLAGAASGDRT